MEDMFRQARPSTRLRRAHLKAITMEKMFAAPRPSTRHQRVGHLGRQRCRMFDVGLRPGPRLRGRRRERTRVRGHRASHVVRRRLGGCSQCGGRGGTMTDGTIRTAVAAWLSRPATPPSRRTATSPLGTSGVTDMSWLFCARQDWMNEDARMATRVLLTASYRVVLQRGHRRVGYADVKTMRDVLRHSSFNRFR